VQLSFSWTEEEGGKNIGSIAPVLKEEKNRVEAPEHIGPGIMRKARKKNTNDVSRVKDQGEEEKNMTLLT